MDENQIARAIQAAREEGINFFDTAQAYGVEASERLLGKALAADVRNRRDEIGAYLALIADRRALG